MSDRQLHYLNRSRLEALRAHECYLRLEPFALTKKKLKKMRPGDRILLGKRPPALEIAREARKVAGALPTEGGVLVGPGEERGEDLCEPKETRLEGRLCLLPESGCRAGERIDLPRLSFEAIGLFDAKGSLRATARLVACEEGYALEILEVHRG